jgi:predicted S18 family serine protease
MSDDRAKTEAAIAEAYQRIGEQRKLMKKLSAEPASPAKSDAAGQLAILKEQLKQLGAYRRTLLGRGREPAVSSTPKP